jgi:dihydroxyacetone kinase-like predicted kinase
MGLVDRMREQVNQLAQRTQEAAQEGRAKLDQVQARRQADAMFRDLGAAVYAERTGRAGPDGPDKIERLIKALSRQEASQGLGDGGVPTSGP